MCACKIKLQTKKKRSMWDDDGKKSCVESVF